MAFGRNATINAVIGFIGYKDYLRLAIEIVS